MKSPQLGMLIKYYVNDSCKAAKQPGWYLKPILFRSDSINMKGNQGFFVWLKWLRYRTKEYIRDLNDNYKYYEILCKEKSFSFYQ